MLFACDNSKKANDNDQHRQAKISAFCKDIFNSEKINSKAVLDNIHMLTDKKMTDTADYVREPKATLFISSSTNSHFQVFENPKGKITALAYYLNGKKINIAEYYTNGQVMCKFTTTNEGLRNGHYACYKENGSFRQLGYYLNGKEITDSLKTIE